MRRRKKNTTRLDGGGDDSDDDEDDDGFQLPADDPSAALVRCKHRLFSSLPHPLLESFVEEFLTKVQMCVAVHCAACTCTCCCCCCCGRYCVLLLRAWLRR